MADVVTPDQNKVVAIYQAPALLPAQLKSIKGWLLWKLEQHHGEKKPRKVPYYIDGIRRSGIQGGAADLDRLATYARACYACEKGGYAGIGLAILPQWGITAVDFDAVVRNGLIIDQVASLLGDTYSEISPSGTGVRAFFSGTVPANRKDNSQDSPFQVEFFASKGFVTVTGNATDICTMLGNEDTTAPITEAVRALYTERFGSAVASGNGRREDIDARAVRDMLDSLDADTNHDVWLRVGLGLHHQFGPGDEGFTLWNDWSAAGKKYPPGGERELRKRWASFRNDDANPVTIGTVRQLARDAGWREDLGECLPIVLSAEDLIGVDGIGDDEAPLPSMVRDNKGRIEATVGNVAVALLHTGLTAGRTLALDEFRDEIMVSMDGGVNWAPFDDAEYVDLRIHLESRGFKPIGREIMRDVVLKVANDRRFDSAKLWLDSLPAWDGIPRISQFLAEYLGASPSEYHAAIGTYLWTALAGRVMSPGIKADMVPIFIGEQGVGKSTLANAMVPSQDFFCEISFAEAENDIARKMRGRLVAELGELRGLHTRDMEHIKSFVTRTHENWIPKYREFNTTFARRLIFIGTTNQREFLADETGNRRWLPAQVDQADVDKLIRDRDQLWAEGREQFAKSGIAWQDAERLARAEHSQYMIVDVWHSTIVSWLGQVGADGVRNSDRPYFTTNDVLQHALHYDMKQLTRREELRVSKILRAMNYENGPVRSGNLLIRAWRVGLPF